MKFKNRIIAGILSGVILLTSQSIPVSATSKGLANLKISKIEVIDYETVSDGCQETIQEIMKQTEKLKDNYSYKKCQTLLRLCRDYIQYMSDEDIKKMNEEYAYQFDGPKAFRYKYSILDYAIGSIFFYSEKNLDDKSFTKKLEELFNSVYEIGRIEIQKGILPRTILYTLDNITRIPELLDLDENLMGHFHIILEDTLFDLESSSNPKKFNFKITNLMTGYDTYLLAIKEQEDFKKSFKKTTPKKNTEIKPIERPKDPKPIETQTMKDFKKKKEAERKAQNKNNKNTSGQSSNNISEDNSGNVEDKNQNTVSVKGNYLFEYSFNKLNEGTYTAYVKLNVSTVTSKEILELLKRVTKEDGVLIEDSDAYLFTINEKVLIINKGDKKYSNEELQEMFSVFNSFNVRIRPE